jgi:hypothetical protein
MNSRLLEGQAVMSAEAILLPLQRAQQDHDSLAHRDILNLDTQTRLKHMVLHFLKYAGKISAASEARDLDSLRGVVIDTVIICLATANALNVSLGRAIDSSAANLDDLCRNLAIHIEPSMVYEKALGDLVKVAGKMAKSIESTDHMERGNPRAEMESLIVDLSKAMFAIVGALDLRLQPSVEVRWSAVEAKSIFYNAPKNR